MAKLKVPYIPDSDLVSIQVTGYFYKKLQTVFLAKGAEKGKEEFVKILEKIKTNDPIEDLYEAEIQVLVALVVAIEKAATAQGKIEYKEVDEEESSPTAPPLS